MQAIQLPDGRTKIGKLICGTPRNPGSSPGLIQKKMYWIPNHPTSTDKREWHYGDKDSEAAKQFIEESTKFYGEPQVLYEPETNQDAKPWNRVGGMSDPGNMKTLTDKDRDYLEKSQDIDLDTPIEHAPYDASQSDMPVDDQAIVDALEENGLTPDSPVPLEVAEKFETSKVEEASPSTLLH